MDQKSGRCRSVSGRVTGVIVSAVILAAFGCGAAAERGNEQVLFDLRRSVAEAKAPSAAATPPSRISFANPATAAAPAPGEASKPVAEIPPAAPRKIIYNAQVTLVVENLNGFGVKFDQLVKESGGYVSQTDQSSQTDAQRNGSWTIRIPVERFSTFLAAVGHLGELQTSHLDSQDVTMEFYDLEARIANKQIEEKRLLKHLTDSTGKLEDILAVERELSRVRGEVEQMQGRIRYLGNLSALSTVTVTVSEIHNYVPPVHPTFAGQIARTVHESLEGLIHFGKIAVLFVVALSPWMPLILVLALLLRWWVRKLSRAARRGPVVLTPPAP